MITDINTSQQKIAKLSTSTAKLLKVLQNRIEEVAKETQGHSKYIWKTLQFLSDLKHAPESPDQFVQHFHNWFRLRGVKSQAENFKEECTSKLHGSTQKKGGGGYWGSTQPSDTHFKPQKAKKKGGGGYWG